MFYQLCQKLLFLKQDEENEMIASLSALIACLLKGGLSLVDVANLQAGIHHLMTLVPPELRDEAIDHIKAILDTYKEPVK